MTTKAKGSSVRQKLINLSVDSGVPFQNLETAFILERLVARLTTDEELQTHLVFKGGFVGLKVYKSPRYTVDVDALVIRAAVGSILDRARRFAETNLDDGVWFRFQDQINLATQGEYGGVRQIYRAGIGEILKDLKKAQVVHFDVGMGDPITPEPLKLESNSLIPPYNGLIWQVYPVETIIAEKMHALIAHGEINSRSKDVYDLSILLPKANPEILREALNRCFTFRETELPTNFSGVLGSMNTLTLERGWLSATSSTLEKPEFQTKFKELKGLIKILEE